MLVPVLDVAGCVPFGFDAVKPRKGENTPLRNAWGSDGENSIEEIHRKWATSMIIRGIEPCALRARASLSVGSDDGARYEQLRHVLRLSAGTVNSQYTPREPNKYDALGSNERPMETRLTSGHPTTKGLSESASQNLQIDVDLSLATNVYDCAGEPVTSSGQLNVPSHSSSCPSAPSSSGRKRSKKESNAGNDSDDDGFGKANKRQNTGGTAELPPPKFFACPYFKRDPVRHLKCFMRFKLKRVKDVKQHLYRKHSLPQDCCPLCWAAFDCRSDCDDHIRKRCCQAREMPEEYGHFMTVDQKKAISKRTDGGLDEQRQWYDVWKVLFSSEDRPASPYLKSTELEELIPIVRWFWKKNSPDIVSSILSSPRIAIAPGAADTSPAETDEVARADEGATRLTDTIDLLLDRVEESIRSFGGCGSPSPPPSVFAPSPHVSEGGVVKQMEGGLGPSFVPKMEPNEPGEDTSAPQLSTVEDPAEISEMDFWGHNAMLGLSSTELWGNYGFLGEYPESFIPE